jgi:hypothetical protein
MLKAAPQWIHHGCLTDLTRLGTVVTQTYRRETARDLILLVARGGVKDCLVCFRGFMRVACRPGPLRAVRSLRDGYTPFGWRSRWSRGDFLPTIGRPGQSRYTCHEVTAGRLAWLSEVQDVDLAVVVEMAAGLS